MSKLLLNPETLAVNQDPATPVGRIVEFYPCPALPLSCQLWARNLSDGTAVAALVNADTKEQTLELDFGLLGPRFAGRTLHVRDLIERLDRGTASSKVTATLPPHATAYFRLSTEPVPPLDVERVPLTPAARRLLGRG